MFRKNLIELTELQIKHTKVILNLYFLRHKLFVILDTNPSNERCSTKIQYTFIIMLLRFSFS